MGRPVLKSDRGIDAVVQEAKDRLDRNLNTRPVVPDLIAVIKQLRTDLAEARGENRAGREVQESCGAS
jgi:hypothetical protein